MTRSPFAARGVGWHPAAHSRRGQHEATPAASNLPVVRDNPGDVIDRLPTAPIAAAGLIAGYAVAIATGSRPLGGVVLVLCGIVCVWIWLRRDGQRVAILLTLGGFGAFALSHVVALAIGAWPAVVLAAAVTFAACRRLSDRRLGVERATAAGAEF